MELGIKIFAMVGLVIMLGIIMIQPLNEIPQDNRIYDNSTDLSGLDEIFDDYTTSVTDSDIGGNISNEANSVEAQQSSLFEIGRLVYKSPSFIVRLGNYLMNNLAGYLGIPSELFLIGIAIISAIALYYFVRSFTNLF